MHYETHKQFMEYLNDELNGLKEFLEDMSYEDKPKQRDALISAFADLVEMEREVNTYLVNTLQEPQEPDELKTYLVPVHIEGTFYLAREANSAEDASEQIGNLIDDDGWEEWLGSSVVDKDRWDTTIGDAELEE